ncbi:MAG TPA: hypothetical protein VGD56_16140 [Gemmatirosa sp.]
MNAPTIPAPQVEVSPAGPEQEPILANLLELYAHDLSALFDLSLQPTGRFGYPSLARYWQDDSRFPFLVRVAGELAGFVLVSRGSRVRDDAAVWDVAEFFVVRRFRTRGVGVAAAADVWRRFPGPWEVRVLERNVPALAFWQVAIASFTDARLTDEVWTDAERRIWRVFSFRSPNPRRGT